MDTSGDGGRSSGEVDDADDSSANPTGPATDGESQGDTEDPNAAGGSGASSDSDSTTGSETADEADSADEDENDTTDEDENDTVEGYVPEPRPDRLEFVFVDGALGPARLGSTIEEIAEALGPAYTVTAEEAIRVDFPSGYSIARDGEVLFWAIEDEGKITVFMTSSQSVGLDSGLRPGLSLEDAILRHGEPALTFGPEGREFASFEDGTGTGQLSVLVAIGQFGGPVGTYDSFEAGAEAVEYAVEGANIKELWFWAE